MNTPKVSIIVPCYLVETSLDRCVSSLVAQTLRDIEIILVDDKSPDATPLLCDEWCKKDGRIRVIHKDVNEGLGMARNSGMDVATGEYIMFIDSDDVYELDACERMYLNAIRYNADVVAGNFITEIQPGVWREIRDTYCDEVLKDTQIEEYVLDLIASPPYVRRDRLHPVCVWALCLRSTIIRENNIRFYSEREIASEDTLFKISFLKCCNTMVCLNFSFYHYTYNVASLTHVFSHSAFNGIKTLRSKMINVMGEDELSLQRVNRFIISDIRMHITRLVHSGERNKIRRIREILGDGIWGDLSCYRPSFYGMYACIFYQLCLWKCSTLLYVYVCLSSVIRKRLMKIK